MARGAGPFPFASLSLWRLRGCGDTLSQTGEPLRHPTPPTSLPDKTPITLIGFSGEEMENPEGEGLRTESAKQEELIDGWEASANRKKPSFDSADFESAHFPPVIITLEREM